MLQTLSLILGSNVNIWLQKFMIKVAKNGGFRFVPSSFLHNTLHIIFIV